MFAAIALVMGLVFAPFTASDPVEPPTIGETPGAGLRLTSDPITPSGGATAPQTGESRSDGIPMMEILTATAALAAAVLERRRLQRVAGEPPPVEVVFVPGHGSPAAGTFDVLIARLGLEEAQVHRFDYRWADATGDHHAASATATIDDTVDALQGFIAGLAASGRPLYLVGFSKGGAALAELIARWDADPSAAMSLVAGAALLDPPIAAGMLGDLQSVGALVAGVPDDGGFDPVTCRFLGLTDCHDRREHLGKAAGVPVIVVRNPDAEVTNFSDRPEGLRVYDLEHDGAGSAWERLWGPGGVIGRVVAAHTGVISHPATSACIADEMWLPGSCHWDAGVAATGPDPKPWWRRATEWLWSPQFVPDSWNPFRDPKPSALSLLDKLPALRTVRKLLRSTGL